MSNVQTATWPPVASARTPSRARVAVLAFAAAMLCAACLRVDRSYDSMSWLDELYTTTLIGAPTLGHMWDGATRGVDGNPPLYLSLAWLLNHVVPVAPERILRPLNVALLAATAVLVYRLGRRWAAPLSVVAGLAVLCCVDDAVVYALLEVRTYALYLFLVAATLSATLAVVDGASPGRAAMLAAVGLLATAAHSFGGFYVLATVGAAGLASRRSRAALALAALPSAAALMAWIAYAFPLQSAVASPYGWIPRPGSPALVVALWGPSPLLPLTALAILGLAARDRWRLRRSLAPGAAPRAATALAAVLASYAALTVAAWLGSQVITSFFVPRYFIPDMLIVAASLVALAEAARRRVRPRAAAAAALVCAAGAFAAVAQGPPSSAGLIPCVDESGRFLEDGAGQGGLPVIAESPHALLPRLRYAPGQVTLYPLDWRVVIDYPDRAPNNAMDFHIMEILRDWGAPGSDLATRVLPTEEIPTRYGRFLVLDEAGRGWFDAFRARIPVSATLLKQGAGCRLWDVDARPAGGR